MKQNRKRPLSPLGTALICLLAMSLTAFAACMKDDLPDLSEVITGTTDAVAEQGATPLDAIGYEADGLPEEALDETPNASFSDAEAAEPTPEAPKPAPSVTPPEEAKPTSPETPTPEAAKPTSPETASPEAIKPTSPETPTPEAAKPTSPETTPESTKPAPPVTTPSDAVKPLPPETTTPEAEPQASSSVSAYERRVAELINEIRRQNGLGELTLNEALCDVAREKSRDMKTLGYFDHTSPTYGSPFDMMKTFGITYRAAGENIAMGYPTPESVVEGWMHSDGHRANILNPSFSEIGMGYVVDGHYWTQMFIG